MRFGKPFMPARVLRNNTRPGPCKSNSSSSKACLASALPLTQFSQAWLQLSIMREQAAKQVHVRSR